MFAAWYSVSGGRGGEPGRLLGRLDQPRPHQLLRGRDRVSSRQRQQPGDGPPVLGDHDLLAGLHLGEGFGKQRFELGNSHGSHEGSIGRQK